MTDFDVASPELSDSHDSFFREIMSLAKEHDEGQFIHDCSELAALLSRHSKAIGEMLLLGFWRDPKDNKTYVIRSASFVIGLGASQPLDRLVDRRMYSHPEQSPVFALEDQFGFSSCNCAVEERRNVRCSFRSPAGDDRFANIRIRGEIASLYQRLLITSQNFINFLDGQIYRRSKPDSAEFHPRFLSYNEISSAVHANYGVQSSYFVFVGSRETQRIDADDLRGQDGSGIEATIPFFRDIEFRHKLQLSISLKQSIVGETVSGPKRHYCLFPAFDSSLRKSPVEGVLIIWASTKLTIAAYRASATWLKEFSALRHIKKASFLADLRQLIEKELRNAIEGGWPGRKARQESVGRVGEFVCRNLCELTNAESATLRIRHDSQRLVRRYASHSTPLAVYIENIRDNHPQFDIKLDEWKTSAIAFAFHYQDGTPHLCFDNVDDIPTAYQSSGLKSILRFRKSIRSEAVLRIQRGGLLAAVLNVESPIESAFREELNFLDSCATIVSDYLTRLEAVGDRVGLASMADTQLAIHSVKSFLANWNPPAGDQPMTSSSACEQAVYICNRLKQNITQRSASTSVDFAGVPIDLAAKDSVRRFNSMLRERFERYLRDTGSDRTLSSIFMGEIPPDFPPSDLSSIVVIIDSIWGNITKHTQLQRNSLRLSHFAQYFARKCVLKIHWTGPNSLPRSIDRDQLFLRPIVLDDGPHYGFFLIGVHSRLLGGHVEYQELEPPKRGFSVRAFVPYDPVLTGKSQ